MDSVLSRAFGARDVSDRFYVRSSIRIVGHDVEQAIKAGARNGSRDAGKLCDRKWQRRARFALARMKRPTPVIRIRTEIDVRHTYISHYISLLYIDQTGQCQSSANSVKLHFVI